MQNKEYEKMYFEMTYFELCGYLQNKYGKPNGNFFLKETCRTKNQKIIRGKSDGLFVHHIAEFLSDDLSKPDFAIELPFVFQTPNWLCYCNYIEHIILHIKLNEFKIRNPFIVRNEKAIDELLQLFDSGKISKVEEIREELFDKYKPGEPLDDYNFVDDGLIHYLFPAVYTAYQNGHADLRTPLTFEVIKNDKDTFDFLLRSFFYKHPKSEELFWEYVIMQ